MSARGYSVLWTEVATRDLERLAAYLAEEAPLRADGIIDRIVARADSLAQNPNRGRVPPEIRSLGDATWRELLDPPWGAARSSVRAECVDDVRSVAAVTGPGVRATARRTPGIPRVRGRR